MPRRRPPTNAVPAFAAAAACYTANVALGTAVATRLIDTSNFRWVHHALYIATCATTAVAASSLWWGRPRPQSLRAARTLLPAAVPLAVIPYAGTRGRRHPLTALAAAPFLFAGLIRSLRPSDRK